MDPISATLFCFLAVSVACLVMLIVQRKNKAALKGWLIALGVTLGIFLLLFVLVMIIAIGMGSPGRPFRRRGQKVVGDVKDRKCGDEMLRQMALEEHASVAAFTHLANDLVAHGAPGSFVERAL